MDTPRHHEIVRPIRELAQQATSFVMDKVLGTDLFTDMLNGPDNSPLDEPVFTQPSFAFDSEGNWHNPEPIPDIAGREL